MKKHQTVFNHITFAIALFLLWTLFGSLSKLLFLLFHHEIMGFEGAWTTISDSVKVMYYGLQLDFAIAGYLTIIPLLLLILHLWYQGRLWRWLWNIYVLAVSFIVSIAFVSNIGLYSYWGFPLDDTSLLYLKTSPADALASMTAMQLILAPIAIALLTAAMFCTIRLVCRKFLSASEQRGNRILQTAVLIILIPVLILPIRGGVGTGTNHTGSVYFSTNIRLNHAAVNPVFSFVEAMMHREEIATRYRFMTDAEAIQEVQPLMPTPAAVASPQKKVTHVFLVILESFSKYIMEESGHVRGVVPNLERMSREGLYFTNFYANSVRTDRAVVSILSALPAQPTMSIMDMPNKSTTLPSLARTLGNNGYATSFYYGGDVNYSNMQSYLVGTGYQKVICDKDFPKKELTGKWGAADEFVFNRVIRDLKASGANAPELCTILTSSSHEPFDIPHKAKHTTGGYPADNLPLASFAYADECLGEFVAELQKLPCWDNTLVVIVPDHLGSYPEQIDNYQLWRYQLPLIMLGGAVPQVGEVPVIGSQIDIPATVCSIVGVDYSDFIYSKDLLNPQQPHFAYFTFQDAMGMLTDSTQVIYDNDAHAAVLSSGTDAPRTERKAKAFLQKLYDFIDSLGK